METAIDVKKELIGFYQRHFDELVDKCIEVSSSAYRWSPLNTLPLEEKRNWVSVGFQEIIRQMTGEELENKGRIYYPRATEVEDAPMFGISDVIDSCECVLLPDEGILPLLWQDYGSDPDVLLALVMEFRKGQNEMTKAHMHQQMEDFEHYVEFSRQMAITEQRTSLEESIYKRFYLALRVLRDKTCDLHDMVVSGANGMRLATEVTQLKMMEADLLAEVFGIDPNADSKRREKDAAPARDCLQKAAESKGLTAREIEVVCLVARGYPNKTIAEHLMLAESTVKNHLSSIISKLGIDNRSQIIVFAAENGYFKA